MALSPLVRPPLPRPELCPWAVGEAEAASAQRQRQVPDSRLELGDSGDGSCPEGKDGRLAPRASPRYQHCAKTSTSITSLRPHSISDSPFYR